MRAYEYLGEVLAVGGCCVTDVIGSLWRQPPQISTRNLGRTWAAVGGYGSGGEKLVYGARRLLGLPSAASIIIRRDRHWLDEDVKSRSAQWRRKVVKFLRESFTVAWRRPRAEALHVRPPATLVIRPDLNSIQAYEWAGS